MKKTVLGILVLAFLVRIAGVLYGLPLWLVDDEPPFILAAMKMLELKTVLPGLHTEAFQSVLYYPPYLSYVLLLPFAALATVTLLFFAGPAMLFPSYLLSDLSGFFIIARLLSVAASIFSIYLLYKVGERLWNDTRAGLFAAFFAATSLIHVALSMTARHWVYVFLCTTLVLYFLSHPAWSEKRRYFLAALTAGLGVGFAIVNAFLVLLIVLWFFLYEKKKLSAAISSTFYWGISLLFSLLAALPVLLYPAGLGFTADTTGGTAKSVIAAILSPALFADTILLSEPLVILFALVGLLFAWKRARNTFLTTGVYIYIYSIIFYLLFRFEPRFFMGLLPFFFLLAGYGFASLSPLVKGVPESAKAGVVLSQKSTRNKQISVAALFLLLLIPLSLSIRLGYLALHNDSRVLALKWIEEQPDDTKVLVLARLTSFPQNKSSLAEQEALDPASIRKVNRAQAEVAEQTEVGEEEGNRSFHALNLADLSNELFYKNVKTYTDEHEYEYLIIQPNYPRAEFFEKIIKESELLVSFRGAPQAEGPCIACGSAPASLSITESQFIANSFLLFSLSELGPPINIYRLNSP